MAETAGRNIAAPLLFLNLVMNFIVLGFASWCLNRYINGQTYHPRLQPSTNRLELLRAVADNGVIVVATILLCAFFFHAAHFIPSFGSPLNALNFFPFGFGGNGATEFFLEFAILASVLGIASKFACGNHLRAWRNDSLAAAGSSSLVAWAVMALAFGLACKEINVGGHRGWRLKMVEAFVIILGITELVYVMLVHAGLFSSRYGPGYRSTDDGYGVGAGGHHAVEPGLKGTRV